MRKFEQTNFTDRNLQKFQDNVANAIGPVLKSEIVDGAHVDVTLASGSNRIAHPLQRQPLGWIIVDRNAAATVYRTAWDSKTISLTASGAITLKLWVY